MTTTNPDLIHSAQDAMSHGADADAIADFLVATLDPTRDAEGQEIPDVDSLVRFREGTPQHAANAGIVYRVVSLSVDRTLDHPRAVAWLEVDADRDLAPSRRRGRSAYLDALELA